MSESSTPTVVSDAPLNEEELSTLWACFYLVWKDPRQFQLCIIVYLFTVLTAVAFLYTWFKLKDERSGTPDPTCWIAHGVTQAICMLAIMAGAFIAMFLKRKSWSLNAHKMLQSFATLAQVPAIMVAWLTTKSSPAAPLKTSWHARLGLCLILLFNTQALMGVLMTGGPGLPFTRLRLRRVWPLTRDQLSRRLRKYHRIVGKVAVALVMLQLLLGVVYYGKIMQKITGADASLFDALLAGWFLWLLSAGVVCKLLHSGKKKFDRRNAPPPVAEPAPGTGCPLAGGTPDRGAQCPFVGRAPDYSDRWERVD